MEQAVECRDYQKKVDCLWYWYKGNGEMGAAKKIETFEAVLNQLKGFKIVVLLASIITALATIANYLKP